MADLLDYLIIAGTGLILFVVAENNLPQIKKVVSNVIPSQYIPVSTEAPRAPVPQSKHCPKGMYPDYTDGILTCRDAHGTRELNPNIIKDQWQAAFYDYDYDFTPGRPGTANPGQPGDNEPGQCINCTTPGQPGIGGQPGAPGIMRGFADQPNMTQPLVQPDINKEIESQIPKKHTSKKHHKKLAEIPDDHKIHAQIECSDNLKCGSNCYKDGKLYKIVCSETERESLYPHQTKKKPTKKQPPSLTIPPNFPSAVTVTPQVTGITGGDEPYPSTEDIGGTIPSDTVGQTNPDFNPPSLDLTPGQQPIRPTLTPTSPTPIAPAPQIGTVFYPFKPGDQAVKGGYAKNSDFNSDGCRKVHYQSGSDGWTCRWQASDKQMRANIGENGYKIEANLHIGPHQPGLENDKEISITSGGPGSASGTKNCCGFTTRINIDTGELQLEAEGPAKTERIFCKGSSCTGSGKSSIAKVVNGKRQPLYGANVQLTWIVTKRGGKATYQAIATGPGGTIMATLPSPQVRGQDLIPFHYIQMDKMADDPHRIRVDTADMKAIDFGTPKVTVIPANAYYGSEGYIHGNEDLLI